MGLRLVLYLGPAAIEFTELLDGGPFPYLETVGSLVMQARAGYLKGLGIGESPRLDVVLCNDGNRVADIIGQPLRARADVFDGDAAYWQGVVSTASYGRKVGLSISA